MTRNLPPFIHPLADPILVELRAQGVGDVLDDARFVDSPCGPVLAPGEPLPVGEHCDCCSHRRIGDHAGPVCPCENGGSR